MPLDFWLHLSRNRLSRSTYMSPCYVEVTVSSTCEEVGTGNNKPPFSGTVLIVRNIQKRSYNSVRCGTRPVWRCLLTNNISCGNKKAKNVESSSRALCDRTAPDRELLLITVLWPKGSYRKQDITFNTQPSQNTTESNAGILRPCMNIGCPWQTPNFTWLSPFRAPLPARFGSRQPTGLPW